jgi:hypothetical protein
MPNLSLSVKNCKSSDVKKFVLLNSHLTQELAENCSTINKKNPALKKSEQ